MKRPWHFWSVYLLCAMLMACTLAWVSFSALRLDRAEAEARQRAELEREVGRALWRMDVKLVPLLAQEAARPYFVYMPTYVPSVQGKGKDAQVPVLSPLTTGRPEHVLLNFQCGPEQQWSSPQVPSEDEATLAREQGLTTDDVLIAERRFAELKDRVNYQFLLQQLPNEWIPLWAARNRRPADKYAPVPPEQAPLQFNSMQQAEQQAAATPSQVASRSARPNEELQRREAAVQQYAQNILIAERQQPDLSTAAREGVSQTLWVDGELLLARRADVEGSTVIQGCWLDWPGIKSMLLAEVEDLLPEADLIPLLPTSSASTERLLAAVPAQLVVPEVLVHSTGWTALRVALATAWICFLIAMFAVAFLSHGVLALSERRDAFVSSVTHELRTPLTTFRMYSEMLAEEMVSDPNQRRAYLQTLRTEADRLFHLVENVLAYSRLERGREGPRRERTTVDEILDRCESRLRERVQQGEMELIVEVAHDTRKAGLETDPSAVEQILFNLVDNACKYAAATDDRRVHLAVESGDGQLKWLVRDHGKGIASTEAVKLFEPFSKSAAEAATSAPGVGLGLALCRRLAKDLGGTVNWEPTDDRGALFVLQLPMRKRTE